MSEEAPNDAGAEASKRAREEEEDGGETAEPPAKLAKTEDAETTAGAGEPSGEETKEEVAAPAPPAAGEDGAVETEDTATEQNSNVQTSEEPAPVEVAPPAAEAPAPPAEVPAVAPAAEAPAPVPPVEAPAPAPPVVAAPVPPPVVAAAPVPPPVVAAAPTGLPPGVPAPTMTAAPVPAYAYPPQQQQQAYQAPGDSMMVEERGEVSSLYVGRVIGKGGEMIRDLQARSGCRIDVDQSVPPGQPRIITYRGTRKTVDFAKQLVHMLCTENVNEADLPLGEAQREIMAVPATSVGKIIGRGGEMIRELQSRSHAKIQVDHNNQGSAGLPPNQKRLTITGTEQSVVKAKEMVNFLVANPMMDAMQALNMLVDDKMNRGGQWGSGPPYMNLPNMGQNMMPNQQQMPYGASMGGGGYDQGGYGAAGGYGQQQPYGQPQMSAPQQPAYGAAPGGMPYGGAAGGTEVELFYAAKNYMGRIIGQKGVTINDLQRRSGCDIQINQDVAPGQDCEITIRGTRPGIESAKQMLTQIIEIGPNHPFAGGASQPSYGGYGQQDPYGQQQQGGYYGGAQAYGGYQQAPAPAYGQSYDPQQQYGYGGAQQQQQPAYGGAYGAPPQQQAYGGYSAAPPPPAAPPTASPWKTANAADGKVYYYNEQTGETQWEKPPGMP